MLGKAAGLGVRRQHLCPQDCPCLALLPECLTSGQVGGWPLTPCVHQPGPPVSLYKYSRTWCSLFRSASALLLHGSQHPHCPSLGLELALWWNTSYNTGGRHTAWSVISPHPPTPGGAAPSSHWVMGGQREEGWESSTGVFCRRSPLPQGLTHCVRCESRDQKHFISGKALSGEHSALENTYRIPSLISCETRVWANLSTLVRAFHLGETSRVAAVASQSAQFPMAPIIRVA